MRGRSRLIDRARRRCRVPLYIIEQTRRSPGAVMRRERAAMLRSDARREARLLPRRKICRTDHASTKRYASTHKPRRVINAMSGEAMRMRRYAAQCYARYAVVRAKEGEKRDARTAIEASTARRGARAARYAAVRASVQRERLPRFARRR